MAKGKIRDQQLARLVGEELDLVLAAASDQRLSSLGVTQVACGAGASHYVVCLAPVDGASPFESVEELRALLEHVSGFLRSQLASALNLKRSPQLSLLPDPLYVLAKWGK
jgi:ribosome-binding factor A